MQHHPKEEGRHTKTFIMTSETREALSEEEIADGFLEHVTGQGENVVVQHMVRKRDLRHHLRITSEHETKDGKRFQIATDFGLSSTMVNLAQED
jgi:hypothetical protein